MNTRFCKIKAFEANIIPDSNDENDFYTIRKEYKNHFDLEDLEVNLDNFVINELLEELKCLDFILKPFVILIVSGYKLAFISTDELVLDEYEIPFAKISIDENGNLYITSLLEDI